MIVISPHLDDAVFSVGAILAAHPGSTVVTVFAGIPPERTLTTYDRSAGFSSSADAVRARRAEDHDALALLAAKSIHGDFLDDPYRDPREDPTVDVANWLREVVPADDVILAPVGIHHPDHIITADACEVLGPSHRYAELPYFMQYPDQGQAAAHGDRVTFAAAGRNVKRRAVERYKSQMNLGTRLSIEAEETVWAAA